LGKDTAALNEINMNSRNSEIDSQSVVGKVPTSFGSIDGCRRPANRLTTIILVLYAGVCFGTVAAHAKDATWLSAPGSGVWSIVANWTPAVVPTGTATFDQSTVTNITFTNNASIGTFHFNAGAPAYSYIRTTGNLTINGTGIVNLSSNSPIFSITRVFMGFHNMSTASNAIINVNDFAETQFSGASTAANSTITTNSNGMTSFEGTSTAANANINNSFALQFEGASTAANSAITTNSGGSTIFFNSSTAGSSTLTTNSGGFTNFNDTSTGGQARCITNAGGIVVISDLTSGGTTAGSIEGAGTYFLGANALTVGLNNLNTEVSGTIEDGGDNGGTGGSLIKVGTGTLTLSGANTYSGGSNFNGGILAVSSDSNLGTGPLSFDGGTLQALAGGGGITSSKAITLNARGGSFLADANTTSTLSGTITGMGSFTKNGAGILVLSGASTYSGVTTVSAGILQAGSSTGVQPKFCLHG
jgi:autotransporter-associated beta strand protein